MLLMLRNPDDRGTHNSMFFRPQILSDPNMSHMTHFLSSFSKDKNISFTFFQRCTSLSKPIYIYISIYVWMYEYDITIDWDPCLQKFGRLSFFFVFNFISFFLNKNEIN